MSETNVKSRFSPILRSIALALVISFGASEVAHAAPGAVNIFSEPLASNPALLKVSPSYAKVHDVYTGHSGKLLIHIQDAHANLSAQDNLAKTLDELIARYKIKTVFVEGGTKDDSLTFLRPLASAENRQRVAKKYLMKNELSGAEYLNLASDRDFSLWGVEQKSLYDKNLATYAKVAKNREAVLAYIAEITKRVESLKRRLFSADMLAFDEAVKKFEMKDMAYTEFEAMLSARAKEAGVPMQLFNNFNALGSIKAMEDKIDFEKATAEQEVLFGKVMAKAGAEAEGLAVVKTEIAKMKSGGSTPLSFFETLFALAKESGISTGEYRELGRYIDYLKAYSKIDLFALIDETRAVQEAVYKASLTDPETYYLHGFSEYLNGLNKLFSLQASTEDYEAYKARQSDMRYEIVPALSFINKKLADLDSISDVIKYEPLVENNRADVEDFYETTKDRDQIFIEKAVQRMTDDKSDIAVLITGGYHTPHLKELMERRGFSYAVVTPNIAQETNIKKYEEILLGQLGNGAPKETQLAFGKTAEALAFAAAAERGVTSRVAAELSAVGQQTADRRQQTGARLAAKKPAEKDAGPVERFRKGFNDLKRKLPGLSNKAVNEVLDGRRDAPESEGARLANWLTLNYWFKPDRYGYRRIAEPIIVSALLVFTGAVAYLSYRAGVEEHQLRTARHEKITSLVLQLRDTIWQKRVDAASQLGLIGTEREIPVLEVIVATDPIGAVSEAASTAILNIKDRTDGARLAESVSFDATVQNPDKNEIMEGVRRIVDETQARVTVIMRAGDSSLVLSKDSRAVGVSLGAVRVREASFLKVGSTVRVDIRGGRRLTAPQISEMKSRITDVMGTSGARLSTLSEAARYVYVTTVRHPEWFQSGNGKLDPKKVVEYVRAEMGAQASVSLSDDAILRAVEANQNKPPDPSEMRAQRLREDYDDGGIWGARLAEERGRLIFRLGLGAVAAIAALLVVPVQVIIPAFILWAGYSIWDYATRSTRFARWLERYSPSDEAAPYPAFTAEIKKLSTVDRSRIYPWVSNASYIHPLRPAFWQLGVNENARKKIIQYLFRLGIHVPRALALAPYASLGGYDDISYGGYFPFNRWIAETLGSAPAATPAAAPAPAPAAIAALAAAASPSVWTGGASRADEIASRYHWETLMNDDAGSFLGARLAETSPSLPKMILLVTGAYTAVVAGLAAFGVVSWRAPLMVSLIFSAVIGFMPLFSLAEKSPRHPRLLYLWTAFFSFILPAAGYVTNRIVFRNEIAAEDRQSAMRAARHFLGFIESAERSGPAGVERDSAALSDFSEAVGSDEYLRAFSRANADKPIDRGTFTGVIFDGYHHAHVVAGHGPQRAVYSQKQDTMAGVGFMVGGLKGLAAGSLFSTNSLSTGVLDQVFDGPIEGYVSVEDMKKLAADGARLAKSSNPAIRFLLSKEWPIKHPVLWEQGYAGDYSSKVVEGSGRLSMKGSGPKLTVSRINSPNGWSMVGPKTFVLDLTQKPGEVLVDFLVMLAELGIKIEQPLYEETKKEAVRLGGNAARLSVSERLSAAYRTLASAKPGTALDLGNIDELIHMHDVSFSFKADTPAPDGQSFGRETPIAIFQAGPQWGIRAGNVRLQLEKKADGLYFHFTYEAARTGAVHGEWHGDNDKTAERVWDASARTIEGVPSVSSRTPSTGPSAAAPRDDNDDIERGMAGRLYPNGARLALKTIDPTTTPAWAVLKQLAERLKGVHTNDLFKTEGQRERAKRFTRIFRGSGKTKIAVDYSMNHINSDVMRELSNLAEQTELGDAISKMFDGKKVNRTENRAGLHIALRAPADSVIMVDGVNVVPHVHEVLEHMREYSDGIRSGRITGYTGKRIRNVVNFGIGGSDLGPKKVSRALKPLATGDINVYYVSNVDPADFYGQVIASGLDPEETVFMVASKTFTTRETKDNAAMAKDWFIKTVRDKFSSTLQGDALEAKVKEAIRSHFIALSTNTAEVEAFGIDKANMFGFWDWVGGRYSLWSAIGLSTAIYVGFDKFEEMLEGAHEMDEHFHNTPFADNIPIILALIDIWNMNFQGHRDQLVMPYAQDLELMPDYLQQLVLESLGKRVGRDDKPVSYQTTMWWSGTPGTNGQHSYKQARHQGVDPGPTEYIAAANTAYPQYAKGHRTLLANMLAQAEALLVGRSASDPHNEFPGGAPSQTIILDRLSPRTLGALLSLYEHRVYTVAAILNIFALNQPGVELGKKLTPPAENLLAGTPDGFEHDGSTVNKAEIIREFQAEGARLAGTVKKGWSAEQMDLFNAVIGILTESGLSAINADLQKYLNSEVDGAYDAFLASNRDQAGVLAETVSDLTTGIHNNYVNSQRGPNFVLYDQSMHDELYRAIQIELRDRREAMGHVKDKKEGKLTEALFLDPTKKWQLKLEHFTEPGAQEIVKAALRSKGIAEENLGKVTINTLNNDYDKLAELRVNNPEWTASKRKEFLAGLQATAIKEVLMVLNDTGTVRDLVDAIESGDKEAKEIAAVKLLAVIKIIHIIRMLQEINMVWRLGNSWDAKAQLPFSAREGALGFEDIMLDAAIFTGMFRQLLKGGVHYDLVPDVGHSFKKLEKHQAEVIALFEDKARLEHGMIRLDAQPFIRKSGLNKQQQETLKLVDIVVANDDSLKKILDSENKDQIVLLGASVPLSAETPPLHKDIYEAFSSMGFQDWRTAYADANIPVVEKSVDQTDTSNAKSPEFLARLIQSNKKMVFFMPTDIKGHHYVEKELRLLLDADNNFELLQELSRLGAKDPQQTLRNYLSQHVTFIFGVRAFLDKRAPGAISKEQLAAFFAKALSKAAAAADGARLALTADALEARYGKRLQKNDESVVDEIDALGKSLTDTADQRALYEWLQTHDSALSADAIAKVGFNWSGAVPRLAERIDGIRDGNPKAAARQLVEIVNKGTFGGLTAPEDVRREAIAAYGSRKERVDSLVPYITLPELPALQAPKPGLLVLERHGETNWAEARLNKWAGWYNAVLTVVGVINAFLAGVLFRVLRIDNAYTSDLIRSGGTMLETQRGRGQMDFPVSMRKELRERDYGDMIGWRRTLVEAVFGSVQYKKWRRGKSGDDVRPPGGENLDDVQERTLPLFITEIMTKIAQGKNVLVALHGNSGRAILSYLRALTKNAALTEEEVLGIEIPLSTPIIVKFDNVFKHDELWVKQSQGAEEAVSKFALAAARLAITAENEAELLRTYEPALGQVPPVSDNDKQLIREMVRDYDYRSRSRDDLSPAAMFMWGVTQARMALDRKRRYGVESNEVLIAKDARKVKKELLEAFVAGILHEGLNVRYISADGPNAVTSYSWAVREFKPLMSVFYTSSHVVADTLKDDQGRDTGVFEKIMGMKTSIVDDSGELTSLTTKEIKEESYQLIQSAVSQPWSKANVQIGKISTSNVDVNTSRQNRIVGLVAAISSGDITLQKLDSSFADFAKATDWLAHWEGILENVIEKKPFDGMKIVIDAAHTPSGYLAATPFRELGADAVVINEDIQEVDGAHKADPSKSENLIELKKRMIAENAQMGLAFDLDGDRGAIVVRVGDGVDLEKDFTVLPPDNLMAAMIPFLRNEGGYDGEKVAFVRDVLSTEGVDVVASAHGAESHMTDAGYVFLKERSKQLRKQGYRIPMMGERSGHAWTSVTGSYENPVAVALIFAAMAKRHKEKNSASKNAFIDVFNANTVPYKQSVRFQPLFGDEFLKKLEKDPRNDTGWSLKKGKPNQKIIAIGRDVLIRTILDVFRPGTSFRTVNNGRFVVDKVVAQDPQTSPDGFYRYADIKFLDEQGLNAGRFVIRASSNDPTWVASFETPVRAGESFDSPAVLERYSALAGIVLGYLDAKDFANAFQKGVKKPGKDLSDQAALIEQFRSKRDLEIAKSSQRQQWLNEAARIFNLQPTDVAYLGQMWDQYMLRAEAGSKERLVIGNNFLIGATLNSEEREKLLGAFNYLAVKADPKNAEAAKNVVITASSMDGGIGESLDRRLFLKKMIELGLIEPRALKDGLPVMTAKGTDLGYELRLKGRTVFVSIAEAKLFGLIAIARALKFAGMKFQPLVNHQSLKSYLDLLDHTPYLEDKLEGVAAPRSYRQALNEAGVEVLTPLLQADLPGIEVDSGSVANPSASKQPGGHGQWGFKFLYEAFTKPVVDDGKIHIRVFYNGDNLNSRASEHIAGAVARNKYPIVKVTTAAKPIDKKGGKDGVRVLTIDGRTVYVPDQMEKADAEKADKTHKGHLLNFYHAGQKGGLGEEGRQPFNTNIFYINETVLDPIVAELVAVIGEAEYARIISPTRIDKPIKNGYLPIDGAIGTAMHNLNAYFMTSTDPHVRDILAKRGIDRLLYFVDIPRTEFFTPTKNAFDLMLHRSDYYRLDPETMLLEDNAQISPPEFTVLNAKGELEDKDPFWMEIQNVENAFGGASMQNLRSFTVQGVVTFAGADLSGDIKLYNKTGAPIDMNAESLRAKLQELFVNDRLTMHAVTVTFNADGSVIIQKAGARLAQKASVPGFLVRPLLWLAGILKPFKWAAPLVLALLAACGGGGGSSNGPTIPGDIRSGNPSVTSTDPYSDRTIAIEFKKGLIPAVANAVLVGVKDDSGNLMKVYDSTGTPNDLRFLSASGPVNDLNDYYDAATDTYRFDITVVSAAPGQIVHPFFFFKQGDNILSPGWMAPASDVQDTGATHFPTINGSNATVTNPLMGRTILITLTEPGLLAGIEPGTRVEAGFYKDGAELFRYQTFAFVFRTLDGKYGIELPITENTATGQFNALGSGEVELRFFATGVTSLFRGQSPRFPFTVKYTGSPIPALPAGSVSADNWDGDPVVDMAVTAPSIADLKTSIKTNLDGLMGPVATPAEIASAKAYVDALPENQFFADMSFTGPLTFNQFSLLTEGPDGHFYVELPNAAGKTPNTFARVSAPGIPSGAYTAGGPVTVWYNDSPLRQTPAGAVTVKNYRGDSTIQYQDTSLPTPAARKALMKISIADKLTAAGAPAGQIAAVPAKVDAIPAKAIGVQLFADGTSVILRANESDENGRFHVDLNSVLQPGAIEGHEIAGAMRDAVSGFKGQPATDAQATTRVLNKTLQLPGIGATITAANPKNGAGFHVQFNAFQMNAALETLLNDLAVPVPGADTSTVDHVNARVNDEPVNVQVIIRNGDKVATVAINANDLRAGNGFAGFDVPSDIATQWEWFQISVRWQIADMTAESAPLTVLNSQILNLFTVAQIGTADTFNGLNADGDGIVSVAGATQADRDAVQGALENSIGQIQAVLGRNITVDEAKDLMVVVTVYNANGVPISRVKGHVSLILDGQKSLDALIADNRMPLDGKVGVKWDFNGPNLAVATPDQPEIILNGSVQAVNTGTVLAKPSNFTNGGNTEDEPGDPTGKSKRLRMDNIASDLAAMKTAVQNALPGGAVQPGNSDYRVILELYNPGDNVATAAPAHSIEYQMTDVLASGFVVINPNVDAASVGTWKAVYKVLIRGNGTNQTSGVKESPKSNASNSFTISGARLAAALRFDARVDEFEAIARRLRELSRTENIILTPESGEALIVRQSSPDEVIAFLRRHQGENITPGATDLGFHTEERTEAAKTAVAKILMGDGARLATVDEALTNAYQALSIRNDIARHPNDRAPHEKQQAFIDADGAYRNAALSIVRTQKNESGRLKAALQAKLAKEPGEKGKELLKEYIAVIDTEVTRLGRNGARLATAETVIGYAREWSREHEALRYFDDAIARLNASSTFGIIDTETVMLGQNRREAELRRDLYRRLFREGFAALNGADRAKVREAVSLMQGVEIPEGARLASIDETVELVKAELKTNDEVLMAEFRRDETEAHEKRIALVAAHTAAQAAVEALRGTPDAPVLRAQLEALAVDGNRKEITDRYIDSLTSEEETLARARVRREMFGPFDSGSETDRMTIDGARLAAEQIAASRNVGELIKAVSPYIELRGQSADIRIKNETAVRGTVIAALETITRSRDTDRNVATAARWLLTAVRHAAGETVEVAPVRPDSIAEVLARNGWTSGPAAQGARLASETSDQLVERLAKQAFDNKVPRGGPTWLDYVGLIEATYTTAPNDVLRSINRQDAALRLEGAVRRLEKPGTGTIAPEFRDIASDFGIRGARLSDSAREARRAAALAESKSIAAEQIPAVEAFNAKLAANRTFTSTTSIPVTISANFAGPVIIDGPIFVSTFSGAHVSIQTFNFDTRALEALSEQTITPAQREQAVAAARLASDARTSMQETRTQADMANNRVNALLDELHTDSSKAVVVEISGDWLPDNPTIATQYLDFLTAHIRAIRAQAYGRNVYFRLVGDRTLTEHVQVEAPGVFIGAEQSVPGAEIVRLGTAPTAGVRNVLVAKMEQGDIPLVAALRIAIEAGRIDINNIPDKFISALKDASGATSAEIDSASVSRVLKGELARFLIRAVTRIDLNAALRYFHMGARMAAQAA